MKKYEIPEIKFETVSTADIIAASSIESETESESTKEEVVLPPDWF